MNASRDTPRSERWRPAGDSGPIAPALLFGAIALAAVAAVRTGFAAGAASLGALAVCATGDSPIRQPAIALILAVVLPACGGARARILPRRAIDLVTTSASALLLAFAVAAYVADRRAEASRDQPPEDRLAALAAAARLDPTNGEIALDRGLVALDLGRLDLALAELARSRPLLANVGTDVAIGSAHALAGDPERAIEAYERAIRRNPASFRAHANLAAPLVTLGRLDEADRHLAVAAALWPGHPRLADLIDRVRRARLDREAR